MFNMWRIADCPDDAASYIHRGCSTARYDSVRRSVLFLLHTEMKMLERLQEKKIPVQFDKVRIILIIIIISIILSFIYIYIYICAST
ncbi:putative RNA helicase [Helianthus anomalus]